MNDGMKIHAKEYLVDFSTNQSNWLKYLILEAINTNGKISEEKLDEIYSCLNEGNEVQLPNLHASSEANTLNICLKRFEHISGVNALAANQTIKFSDDITVLYGLNGAGKSSYFKVLNEMVGGNERKEILPNIHANQPEPIQVKLTFNDGNSHELIFDNSKRGTELLAGCKVFDSSYLTGLLSQRTQGEAVLEPLGLHLFKYIADRIDDFKNRLKKDAYILKNSKPSISYDKFSDQLKGEFETHNVSEQTISLLNEKFVFTNEKDQQLKDKKTELATLRQTNYADRINLLSSENQEIRKIYDFLKKKKQLEAETVKIQALLENKREKEKANMQALEKISILNELPFSGTTEWKDFISAGSKLKEKSNSDSANCIYCNQPLQDDAVRLVKAYAEYLGDKTEGELRKATNILVNAKKEINAISTSLNLSVNFSQKHNDACLEDSGILFTTSLSEAQESIEDFKYHLLGLIDEKEQEQPGVEVHPKLHRWLVSKYKENARTIRTLKADDTQKNENIEALDNELKVLTENKLIAEQKDNIENWIKIDQKENVLRKKESEINTNSVTRLSNTVHNKLLTSELNKAFKDELERLGHKSLEVNLVKARGGKGSNSTKLLLKDNNSIRGILSEG